jgi:hypothetical protein
MFLVLNGCAEFVSLPLRFGLAGHLFSGESLGFFNNVCNFKA